MVMVVPLAPREVTFLAGPLRNLSELDSTAAVEAPLLLVELDRADSFFLYIE